VVDSGGTALEGVQITVKGGAVERQVFTDAEGRFRFPALPEGGYRVQAELLGLSAEQNSSVYIGTTTEISLTVGARQDDGVDSENPSQTGESKTRSSTTLEESIQVVALAPLLDPYDASVGTTVRTSFLNDLPVERIYQSVALLLPGVSGGEDGNPNVSGALRGSNLFLVDGVDTTDPTTGLFGLNLSLDAVRAVDVTSAGAPVQFARGAGGIINVVTRTGDNEFRGSLRWLATNPGWNDDYDYPPEEVFHLRPEIAAANAAPEDLDSSLAASLGGPLWADRLWFFASYETSEASFFRPTRSGFLWNEGVSLDSDTFKLTWRPAQGHLVEAQRTADRANFTAFTPFDRGPAENKAGNRPSPLGRSVVGTIPGDLFALQDQGQEGDFTKLQWNWAQRQNLSLEVVAARQRRKLTRDPLSLREITASAPHLSITRFTVTPTPEGGLGEDLNIQEVVLFNGILDQGFEDRPRDQLNISMSHFFRTGKTEHDLKLGTDYQGTDSERRLNVAGIPGVDPATGLAVDGQVFLDLDTRPACLVGGECLPFDANSGAFQPFTFINFWRREPRTTTSSTLAVYGSDSISRDRWLLTAGIRAEQAEGKDDQGRKLLDHNAVAPRLAFKVDPLGDGKVLLSASVGRYYEPVSHQFFDAFARSQAFSGFTQYAWAGAFGFDCEGLDPADLDSPCWLATDIADFEPIQLASPDRGLKRAYVDEIVVGFERQLTRNTSVQLHYVDRQWNDLWDNILILEPGGGLRTLQAEVRNLPFAERTYRGLQFLLQRRYQKGWQLLGSYTWSEAEGNLFRDDGLDSFADFVGFTEANRVNRQGLAPYDRTHRLRAFGTYLIEGHRVSLILGSAFRFESGVPYQAQADGDFGELFLTPRGELSSPDILQLDLSTTVRLRPAKNLEMEVKAEVFNLTNEQERLASETNVNLGFFGLAPSTVDLQAPRNYRLSVALKF